MSGSRLSGAAAPSIIQRLDVKWFTRRTSRRDLPGDRSRWSESHPGVISIRIPRVNPFCTECILTLPPLSCACPLAPARLRYRASRPTICRRIAYRQEAEAVPSHAPFNFFFCCFFLESENFTSPADESFADLLIDMLRSRRFRIFKQ